MKLRICRRCEIERELIEFPKNDRSKRGRIHLCKICINDDQRAYNLANREKVNRKAREYYADNKDRLRANRRKLRKKKGKSTPAKEPKTDKTNN